MQINPLFAIDFYKVDHRRQYPEGTTEIYSNFTPRYVKPCHSLSKDFDNQVVFFGLQYAILDFLMYQFETNFFLQPKDEVIKEYKQLIEDCLNVQNFDCSHLEKLHDLGYLPIRIKALEEGCRVPIGVPVLSIVNTHPDFFWLTNYLETVLSSLLWKPTTIATIAFEFKKLLTEYALKTGTAESFVDFQAHDFSFRGMSGLSDAILSGMAHLTSFKGTDCVPAIREIYNYYPPKKDGLLIGTSVAATEHSVMCCNGIEGEFETFRRLIEDVYPHGIVSIVSDTYNFWQVLTCYLPRLKNEINKRQGKVVIRPDSGNPFHIVCGDKCALPGTPQHKGALELLWEEFGGTINEKGYREISSQVGLIYGDSITLERAKQILEEMEHQKFASSNIIFGIGSFTYQYVTRDTLGFAMKATNAVINGESKAIFKDPLDRDVNKKSAKGYLRVEYDLETAKPSLIECVSKDEEAKGELKTVFENGKLFYVTDIETIRNNINLELEIIR